MKVRNHARTRGAGGGFILMEAMIAAALTAVAISTLMMVIVSHQRLTEANRETALAEQAAREMLETVRGVAFAQVFASFNADPADDPAGAGTAPGSGFAVFGLDPVPGDADGMVGEILFPLVGGLLREDAALADLGMPRDLNADAAVDAADRAADYVLLPLQVRLRWRGASGNRALTVNHLMTAR